jgi:hypothetical protein
MKRHRSREDRAAIDIIGYHEWLCDSPHVYYIKKGFRLGWRRALQAQKQKVGRKPKSTKLAQLKREIEVLRKTGRKAMLRLYGVCPASDSRTRAICAEMEAALTR